METKIQNPRSRIQSNPIQFLSRLGNKFVGNSFFPNLFEFFGGSASTMRICNESACWMQRECNGCIHRKLKVESKRVENFQQIYAIYNCHCYSKLLCFIVWMSWEKWFSVFKWRNNFITLVDDCVLVHAKSFYIRIAEATAVDASAMLPLAGWLCSTTDGHFFL